MKHAETNKKNIKVCALTGCAAILLECKATTLHMFSGIGFANKKNDEIIQELFTTKRYKLKNWRNKTLKMNSRKKKEKNNKS